MTTDQPFASAQFDQPALRLVQSTRSSAIGSPELRRLERELAAARAEVESLQELLEELPTILERKFKLRLRALQAEQWQLEQENVLLSRHLLALKRGEIVPPSLISKHPTSAPDQDLEPAPPASDSPITFGVGLRRALRHLHR